MADGNVFEPVGRLELTGSADAVVASAFARRRGFGGQESS
jgi:hypothetical protein